MIEKFKNIGQTKICVICEGYEEQDYIKRLINLGIFSFKYYITTINAKSINTIVSKYQEKYQSNSYDIVLIFCIIGKSYLKNVF